MSEPPPTASSSRDECSLDDPVKILAELEQLRKENAYLRSRVRYLESGRTKCKPSKWSKVKGAFGWEKETSLTLKVPEWPPSDLSSSFSVSPAGSCVSHLSSLATPPPPLSSSSSEEDIRHQVGRRSTLTGEGERRKNDDSRRSKSLDGDPISITEHGSKASSFKNAITKGGKTPWSKVKGIIHTKSVRKRGATDERWSHDASINERRDADEHHWIDDEPGNGASRLTAPKLTVTLPSNEELTAESSPRKYRRIESPNKTEQTGETSPGTSRKSKWFKVRNVFLQGSRSAPASPVRATSFTYDLECDDISSGDVLEEKEDDVFQDEEHLRYEIEASYVELQNKLEEELTKKYCREVNLSPEFKKKLEEWDKMKGGNVPTKEWENEKERRKKEKWNKPVEEEKIKKGNSREGSIKKHKSSQDPRQEVLIPTSTGTFRFEGISDNFTRKLYEWEQARGIAPEASTFALLGPEYQPFFHTQENGLARSKSIGSLADLNTTPTLAQQPSSLSLNDMDDFTHCGPIKVTREDPKLNMLSREPLFCSSFAQEDTIDRTEDSSSSNDGKDLYGPQVINSSYQLLQDNIALLNKLKKERDVCRQLEDDMKSLESEINNVSKSFTLDHAEAAIDFHNGEDMMRKYEMENCFQDSRVDLRNENDQGRRLSPMREYTVKLEDFTKVRTTLFDDEATQTTYDYDDGRCHNFCSSCFVPSYEDTGQQFRFVLTSMNELQDLAFRLEMALVDRESESFHLKSGLFDSEDKITCYRCDSHGPRYGTYTLPTQWLKERRNRELCGLTKLINEKLLELKQALNFMSTSQVNSDATEEVNLPPPMSRSLHRTTAQEDLSPGDVHNDYRPASRASSSASSISYHAYQNSSMNRLHQGWSSPFPYQHRFSSSLDHPRSPLVMGQVQTGSYSDVTSDGEFSDSGLQINAPNVFVPTMRKIFSPVSDSEAVGVIIAEEDENIESSDADVINQCGQGDDEESVCSSRSSRLHEDKESIKDLPLAEINRVNIPIIVEEDIEDASKLKPTVSLRLRARSSSPMVERKTVKFSSGSFVFPLCENGVVIEDASPPIVGELPLNEELASSLKMRALRIKKAKEEFLMGTQRSGSLSVVVGEDLLALPKPNSLMVKSASAEIITQPKSVQNLSAEKVEVEGRRNSFLNMLKIRRRSKDGSNAQHRKSSAGGSSVETTVTASCPSTPAQDKRTESGAVCWIKNPAKMIFRPKGKYMISND